MRLRESHPHRQVQPHRHVSPPSETYVANLELIERAIEHACRRHHLYSADAQDFGSAARLHLIDNDYAVLKAFRGESKLQTYLATVLTRCFLDWRNARWGKWRPSAEARRLGPLAIHLERLITRDGLSFDEACETLRTNLAITASRHELAALAARFPHRSPRAFVSDDGLEAIASEGSQHADRLVVQDEAVAAAERAAAALEKGLKALPPQDRLILRMRFHDDFPIADIARALSLDAKPLYRRIERLLAQLRALLERSGVTAELVSQALSDRGFDLVADQRITGESVNVVRLHHPDERSSVREE
jgi:RNA polymerase sigma factor (sigma-70 family)